MDYKVILAPQAIADLENAVRHIAKNNPQPAFRFGNLLLDRVAILKDFPELGPPYRKRPRVRRLSSRPYIIFYRINHEQRVVEVMRYWHAARGDVELGPPAT